MTSAPSSSSELMDLGTEFLLTPAGLSLDSLETGLVSALGVGTDFAELFLQKRWNESWSLEEGRITSGNFNIDGGVGIRSVSKEKTGFAYSSQISSDAFHETGRIAASITRSGRRISAQAVTPSSFTPLYATENPLDTLSTDEKVALLKEADSIARNADPAVIQVSATLTANYEVVMVHASDGTLAADVRPMVRLNVSVLVQRNGRREAGSAGGGGRFGLDVLKGKGLAERFAKEAVRKAMLNLDSIDAPAGDIPVVLGAGWPGILLHEAVGHGLEGDFNRKESSSFSGRIGEQVASRGVTVVDDGTLPNRRGSLSVDDEGTPTACTPLIEDGYLTGYMQDKLNARLMGMPLTGNGRRESYAHLPMPRMTNTYMQPGNDDPADIIASVDKGLYAVGFKGGQVDITTGQFVFAASEAYLIEKGRITAPVKGATLIGNGPDVMSRISMIGHDLALDEGMGNCGKEGQTVPVGVGQPTLKLDSITVGGTHVS